MKFCPNCGAAVAQRVPPGDSLPRYVCDQCGEIHYQNPRVVVGSIPEFEGKLLLCRRAIEPRRGYWTLPAGVLELGESTEQGALRETLEEAGARVALRGLYTLLNVVRVGQVHLFYRAELLDIDFAPGPESLEVALFGVDELPWEDLAFRTVTETLKRYVEERPAGRFGVHCADIA